MQLKAGNERNEFPDGHSFPGFRERSEKLSEPALKQKNRKNCNIKMNDIISDVGKSRPSSINAISDLRHILSLQVLGRGVLVRVRRRPPGEEVDERHHRQEDLQHLRSLRAGSCHGVRHDIRMLSKGDKHNLSNFVITMYRIYAFLKISQATILLCVGYFFNGSVSAGYVSSYVDLSPNFSGTLMGLGGTMASCSEIVAFVAIAGYTANSMTFLAWKAVFLKSAAVYLAGAIVYAILVEGQTQVRNREKARLLCLQSLKKFHVRFVVKLRSYLENQSTTFQSN